MDPLRFYGDTPTARITIRGPLGERDVQATIDTGAFKSLIPLSLCTKLGLRPKEFRDVRGVSEKEVRVEIFWADVIFQGRKAADTVVGFNLPVGARPKEHEKSLIGRDVLKQHKLLVDFKAGAIGIEDC